MGRRTTTIPDLMAVIVVKTKSQMNLEETLHKTDSSIGIE
jgi:hypothetical protein